MPSSTQTTDELLACLALVAPSGLSSAERVAWVRVARETLKDFPDEMVLVGCSKARQRCRFASEIVPTIVEEANAAWVRRGSRIEYTQPQLKGPDPFPAVSHEETQRILREVASAYPTRRSQ